jgi:hypothetical protein
MNLSYNNIMKMIGKNNDATLANNWLICFSEVQIIHKIFLLFFIRDSSHFFNGKYMYINKNEKFIV